MDKHDLIYVLEDLKHELDEMKERALNRANATDLETDLLAFDAKLQEHLDRAYNDPGYKYIAHFGCIVARWIRRFAPGLTAANVDKDILSLVITELVTEIENRHWDTDQWSDARYVVYDDIDLWEDWLRDQLSEVASETVPELIYREVDASLSEMGIIAAPECATCGRRVHHGHIGCPGGMPTA